MEKGSIEFRGEKYDGERNKNVCTHLVLYVLKGCMLNISIITGMGYEGILTEGINEINICLN